MYEYLNGKLAAISPTNAVVDCNGVGYTVGSVELVMSHFVHVVPS